MTVSDVDALLALHHRAQHEFETFRDAYPAEGGLAAHQATYAAAEQAATTLFCYQPLLVHARATDTGIRSRRPQLAGRSRRPRRNPGRS